MTAEALTAAPPSGRVRMACELCGRTGERGFDVFLRVYPAPNRIICSNWNACAKRIKAKP